MEPVTIAAGIGAAANVTSNVATGLYAKKRMKQAQKYYEKNLALQNDYQKLAEERQFKYNKELADYEFEQNKKMWQLENEYNTPSAQMARYRQAGLNANLIYGQNNLSADGPSMAVDGVSTSAPSASPGALPSAQFDFSGVGNSLIDAQRLKIEQSVADSTIRKNDADTLSTITDNDIKGRSADAIVEGVTLANQKTEGEIKQIQANTDKTVQETEKLKVDTELAHQEMKKSEYEIRITQARADLENLLYKQEKARSPYYDQNAYYENQINKYMTKLKVQETQKMQKDIDNWDEQFATNMAYQAAQILGLNTSTTAVDMQNRINQILNDPDFTTDKYWSAILLNTLRGASDKFSFQNILDLIGKANFNPSSSPAGQTLLQGVK